MSTITAIEPQKNDPQRVSIHLDGEYAFGLARIVAAWLKVGQDLPPEKAAALQQQDALEQAYQQASLFLSFRARSEAEIRRNLNKHKYPEEIIQRTLERLRQEHLADDPQFAHAWVENRSTFRPRSRRALQVELRQKGLSDADTQSALAGLDEEALAYSAALKKARRLESLEWPEFRRKLSEFLSRRGFPYSITQSVVTRIWTESHARQPILDPEENA